VVLICHSLFSCECAPQGNSGAYFQAQNQSPAVLLRAWVTRPPVNGNTPSIGALALRSFRFVPPVMDSVAFRLAAVVIVSLMFFTLLS
jgi:hypothetical protein